MGGLDILVRPTIPHLGPATQSERAVVFIMPKHQRMRLTFLSLHEGAAICMGMLCVRVVQYLHLLVHRTAACWCGQVNSGGVWTDAMLNEPLGEKAFLDGLTMHVITVAQLIEEAIPHLSKNKVTFCACEQLLCRSGSEGTPFSTASFYVEPESSWECAVAWE